MTRLKKDNAALQRRLDKATKASRRIAAASSNSPRSSSRRLPRCWHRSGTRVPAAVQTASPPTPWPRAVPLDERDHGVGRRREGGRQRGRSSVPKSSHPPLPTSDTVSEEHKTTEERTPAKEDCDGHQDPVHRAPLPYPLSCTGRPGRPLPDRQRRRRPRHKQGTAASHLHRL